MTQYMKHHRVMYKGRTTPPSPPLLASCGMQVELDESLAGACGERWMSLQLCMSLMSAVFILVLIFRMWIFKARRIAKSWEIRKKNCKYASVYTYVQHIYSWLNTKQQFWLCSLSENVIIVTRLGLIKIFKSFCLLLNLSCSTTLILHRCDITERLYKILLLQLYIHENC